MSFANYTVIYDINSLEKLYGYEDIYQWMKNKWQYSFGWSILYLICIFGGQSYMKYRPAFQLRTFLILWNMGLAIFSIIGTVRMGPNVYRSIEKAGLINTVCNIGYFTSNPPSIFWSGLFMASKVLEFGDTAFIVLRKQKLIFLHWYHHILTLIFSWFNYSRNSGLGILFMIMNYFVHSIMYTYFALKACKMNIPRSIASCITTLQIIQMVLGLGLSALSFLVKMNTKCNVSHDVIIFSLIVYFTYFILFCQFFYNSYLAPKDISKHKKVM
ncbi:very long chain fatty acid elongase 6-like [Centruroides vittatus]|uniref:very long chain fatty acid elongase 6-like n=1 Tax=Centruroides vittatus TaxID=120091 RepID=UPI00350F854F